MPTHVDRAEKALAKNDIAAALTSMLEAWREKRAPAYAAAIDVLSKAAARTPKLDTHEAWIAVALENDPADLGPLLDALLTAGKVSTLGGRLEQLIARPDDPRIAMAFAKAALEPPFTASSNFSLWTKMYDAMIQIGDTRVVEILEKRLAKKQGGSNFWPRHYKALEKILKQLPEAPKVSADEKKRLTALAKAAKTVEPAPARKKKAATVSAPKGEPLERAAVHAEAGAWRECLTALVEAWRPTRAAPFGDAIERVSAILEDGRPPPTGKKLQAAWLAMAAKKDIADVGLLAESSSDPKAAEAESNMDAMMTWPEDPRIGRAMLAKLYAMTFSDRTRAWTLVRNLIVRNVDERFKPAIDGLDHGTDNKARNACLNGVAKDLAPVFAKIRNELGPVDEKLLARVNAAVDAHHARDVQTERKFIDDIVADRDSDGPYLVYADWLTEHGHPRGELIILQCAVNHGTATEKQQKRIKELFQESPRALLGPIANLVYQNLSYTITSENVRFDRGLVDDLELYCSPPFWTFRESPLLRVVRTLRPNPRSLPFLVDLVKTPCSLRSIDPIDFKTFIELCQLPAPTAIEEITVHHWREREEPLAPLLPQLAGIGLSNLKSFAFIWQQIGRAEPSDHIDTLPDAFYASPIMNKLERLKFSTNIGPQLEGLRKYKRKVRTLTLDRHSWGEVGIDIELDDKLVPRAIVLLDWPGSETNVDDAKIAEIREALRNIDGKTITELRISPKLIFEDAARATLDSIAAERFAGASVHVR